MPATCWPMRVTINTLGPAPPGRSPQARRTGARSSSGGPRRLAGAFPAPPKWRLRQPKTIARAELQREREQRAGSIHRRLPPGARNLTSGPAQPTRRGSGHCSTPDSRSTRRTAIKCAGPRPLARQRLRHLRPRCEDQQARRSRRRGRSRHRRAFRQLAVAGVEHAGDDHQHGRRADAARAPPRAAPEDAAHARTVDDARNSRCSDRAGTGRAQTAR